MAKFIKSGDSYFNINQIVKFKQKNNTDKVKLELIATVVNGDTFSIYLDTNKECSDWLSSIADIH
jgi:hypothetical protein